MNESSQCKKQIDELLNLPQQMWLLGAGISKNSGIPLMYPLTERVESILDGENKEDFGTIRNDLPDLAHVEHVLSHIGDLIAIAERMKSKTIDIGGNVRNVSYLHMLHRNIQSAIKNTMRWGYIPGCDGNEASVGTKDTPIVSIENHSSFVKALFQSRRAGLERRAPVAFFTTNYDTLLEDALSLCRIITFDGFHGGAMAFWEPGHDFQSPFADDSIVQARIYKLHGSIDWITNPEDIVVRRREGAGYPDETNTTLLIYPQATKYKVTQRDPFATLFRAFRSGLVNSQPGLLAVCGYSFSDDHINEEIERALKQRDNRLTVLAFILQNEDRIIESEHGLPGVLSKWLGSGSGAWKERVLVAGSRGVYHGSLDNRCPCEKETSHSWWSFEGLTSLLLYGPEVKV